MLPSDETAATPPAASSPLRPAPIVNRDGDPVPARLRGAVAALGNFDGIHQGHRALIAAVREEAAARGVAATVLTFEPHPREFFAPDRPMFRLTDEAAKLRVLDRLGLDGVFVRRFDAALAGTGAEGFVAGLLRGELGLSGVVIGHDFHFGRGREGTPEVLRALCARHGLACRIVGAVAPGAGAAPVSSSAIRAALEAGDVAAANRLLGYRWFVTGTVRHGDKRGRTLGFPTANMALRACGLAHGIYAVRVRLADGSVRDGVASYGRRPTFDDGAPLLETFLFDFSGDLYGQEAGVEFVGWIRGEARFDGAEALVAQMHDDAARARRILAGDATPSMLG
ncbi:bifunctional riboflavin kinase/FAD synthetase [Methylobacterium oryzihabitans]|uniref:Riboflavin biosynthesis protein n=1 Tax=Methylobacterium oryzihabitans TaxID=2499852 RepID=A0A437PC14_9HYPH|nr:bifunctional riboflavin kinase/FAD synthetase [Methylobacterium oryzihabitans]RVU19755.1 bifunctional riboflavin kinase/FAD synthetase [Methylobacterium oryzihabitans]